MNVNQNTIYSQTLKSIALGLFIIFALGFLSSNFSFADTIEQLKSKIENTNDSYEQIQKEIKGLESELKTLGEQKNSLTNDIKIIDITTKKLLADISLNENRITGTNLQIEQLAIEIGDKKTKIGSNYLAIGETLRALNIEDKTPFVVNILKYDNISDAWTEIEFLSMFQDKVKKQTDEVVIAKVDLEDKKQQSEQKKEELLVLKASLDDRKKILAANRLEKDKLLKLAKNKATSYEKELAVKKARAEAIEQELARYESELRMAIDPKSIPPAGKGILAWPLSSVRITQKFGITADSGRLYKSGSHNGVDFGATVGTPVKSAGNGVVEGIGDTDTVCPGASFGKWVFIRYDNGLASTYAHFSLIKVKKGQRVKTGEVVGYSGNTGYSTGPHLHMTVYASQGVKISTIKSTVCGGTYTVPLADPKAYLDPLIYL
ncbi:MAG: peptidoglycan DD-metalloendopeptidase family protein [Minisyncoccia bacterium]